MSFVTDVVLIGFNWICFSGSAGWDVYGGFITWLSLLNCLSNQDVFQILIADFRCVNF